jgi:hypothetical protein
LTSLAKQTPHEFKIFLKAALGDKCPPEILTRRKWGFDTPLSRWVTRPELFPWIQSLSSGEAVRRGFLRGKGVRTLTRTPEAAHRAARRVWNLLVLDVWLRVHARKNAPAETLAELLEESVCIR